MILFAHFIACSLENNVNIVNPSFDEYAKYFRATSQDLITRYPGKQQVIPANDIIRRALYYLTYYLTRLIARSGIKLGMVEPVVLGWEDNCRLDGPEFIALVNRKPIVLAQGWKFRAKSLFKKHEREIRNYFRPLEKHERKIEGLLRAIRLECDVLIGVHVRLGDYITFKGGKYYFRVDRYQKRMRQVEKLFPGKKVGFLVCSNEQLMDQSFVGLRVFFGTGHPVEDMYELAGCDYIMGPPSTFSMWASFYSEVPLCQFEDIERDLSLEDFTYSLDRCALT